MSRHAHSFYYKNLTISSYLEFFSKKICQIISELSFLEFFVNIDIKSLTNFIVWFYNIFVVNDIK